MELALRLLLLLKKLIIFFRKRWDQSTRRLWYIFALVRSRILPRSPKKKDKTRRNIEYRPAKPPTTVICASKYPAPPLTPIIGGHTPISPAASIPIQVRQPTVSSPGDAVDEAHGNPDRGLLSVDGYFLEGIRPISRSNDPPTFHREPEDIHLPLPPHPEHIHLPLPSDQEDDDSHSPVTPARPISQFSDRSGSQYSYRAPSQYSIHPPSQHSNRSHLNGAESAARGFLDAPPPPRRTSPAQSVRSARPGSIANSVSSRVYRASRPKTRVARPSPMRNTSKHRARSSTPASPRHSVHDVPPELPQVEPRTSGSIHRERPSPAVSFGPALPAPDRLRPMVGIDRYEKRVVIEDKIHSHVYPPVTTEFVR